MHCYSCNYSLCGKCFLQHQNPNVGQNPAGFEEVHKNISGVYQVNCIFSDAIWVLPASNETSFPALEVRHALCIWPKCDNGHSLERFGGGSSDGGTSEALGQVFSRDLAFVMKLSVLVAGISAVSCFC